LRVPLVAGSTLAVVNAPDDAVLLRPPPPSEAVADVGAAVRDACRFPLAGEPLSALVPRGGGRATIVVEPPALPLPSAQHDPRQAALAATVDELERLGIPSGYQTLLVAGGLTRRAGQRELETLVTPELGRSFHGRVLVHDAEDPELVKLDSGLRVPLRVNRALVEADTVVVVSAAESVLHGGPAALLGAANVEALRAAGAPSLLETAGSLGWEIGVALERALLRRVPVLGVSLALNQHRLLGALRGYPYDQDAVDRIARSPLRRVFRVLPGRVRAQVLRSLPLELTAAAAFAGPPSVAHSEALLRAVELRSAHLAEPVDAVCIGVPRATPYLPRERPNPLLGAYLALGIALRMWRDAFPVTESGTAILVHRFQRHFAHPTQQPYRAFFTATRGGPVPDAIAAAEEGAARDPRAVAAYRDGRSCHPLLPFRDWEAVRGVVERLGEVLVAGCRDATAARQLGFVPVHGLGAALEMAHGWRDRPPRIAFLLAPPYFPIRVTE
jgi:hypothetical protein